LGIGYGEFKQNRYIDHKYEGYIKQVSYGGEFAPGRQIPQLGTISLVGELRRYDWDEPGKPKRQTFTKIGLGIRSLVDTRDALSFPEHGKFHKFYLQFASNLHDGTRTYTRFENILEAYYKLGKRLNLHPRFVLGISSDFMPYFDEFSLGGMNNFLGLYKDEFLGDKIITGSVELRQKVGDRSYIMARYNAGNVWNDLETVKLSKLRHGGGIGLGIKTPVGPAQVWYGRTSKGLDRFYFDLGYEW
jgi:outer membrane protein insertion porin family